MHIIRMSCYAQRLAAKLGFSKEDCELILVASSLHDIGKVAIPDSILLKPQKLTNDEWTMMRTHTTIGSKLLAGSSSKVLKMAQEIALTHHEKWDGSGYPQALKGEKIPLVGRICGLCDMFDALTNERPYKEAWPFPLAVEEIKKESGRSFDPSLVENFLEILPEIHQIQEKYNHMKLEDIV
jgi:putative two-component system response regulator